MANQRGHTPLPVAAGEQLELTWEVPSATPATTDFVCWLWAAFPPRDGKLHVSRIAKALGVPATTLRRWISADTPKLQASQMRKIHQRAILRGRGHYLWPNLDPVSQRRSELFYANALRNDELITTEPKRIPPTWHENGTTSPHLVHIVYYPRAHVFGVSAANHDKAQAKLVRTGQIIESNTVSNKFAAIALKHEILRRVDEHRCITPRALVLSGRTETWREVGGPTTVRRPLVVVVVRFAGRSSSFARVAQGLREELPAVCVTEYVVRSAQEACEAVVGPADVVILAGRGYTRQTWDARRPWPGGQSRWYVGGRGVGDAGMSLAELTGGAEQLGGIQAPLLVLDVGEADAAGVKLRRLTAGARPVRVLANVTGRHGTTRMRELVDLVGRVDLDREDLDAAAAGLDGYR